MNPHNHEATASRIERSLRKCSAQDHELLIEGAMLAASHRLNAHLHRLGVTREGEDFAHTYLLTVAEFRRLSIADNESVAALGAIEDLRPAFVRGNHPGGADAAQKALGLLATIRERTRGSEPDPITSKE